MVDLDFPFEFCGCNSARDGVLSFDIVSSNCAMLDEHRYDL